MAESPRNILSHDYILSLIVEVVELYEENNLPSPTISEISTQLGISEELILESMEFGVLESANILH